LGKRGRRETLSIIKYLARKGKERRDGTTGKIGKKRKKRVGISIFS